MTNSIADKIRDQSKLLTAQEVTVLLSIPVKTLYKYAKQERIPSFKIGAKIFFDSFQLADWYEKIALT